MIEFGHGSHVGLRREHNEDTYWADAEAGLFLVADGMGGPGRGELAAAIARDTVVDAVRGQRDPGPALRAASEAIAAHATEDAPPPGAAIALLRIEGERFCARQVGDCRVFLWRDGQLAELAEMAAEGDPEAGELPPAPPRNRATQALGITPTEALYTEPVEGTLARGMQFLLCTGGLAEALDRRLVATILARGDLAAQECVDHLLLATLAAGGHNNATAVLARVA